ncbi:hypothetical protein NDU88_006008 [Pleurodeles waltl]|uniref:Uncharacterized protein n=1 Tax=Pleurodeles waltl TaxID=8319 RepID=A0AAV7VLP1_PLEWA|nr:hypothetical protein NDU88_006008 [Pleurodeles waltl]
MVGGQGYVIVPALGPLLFLPAGAGSLVFLAAVAGSLVFLAAAVTGSLGFQAAAGAGPLVFLAAAVAGPFVFLAAAWAGPLVIPAALAASSPLRLPGAGSFTLRTCALDYFPPQVGVVTTGPVDWVAEVLGWVLPTLARCAGWG